MTTLNARDYESLYYPLSRANKLAGIGKRYCRYKDFSHTDKFLELPIMELGDGKQWFIKQNIMKNSYLYDLSRVG